MQLNTRQLCFLVGGLLPMTKIVVLPSVLATYAGKDLWLPALALLLLQAAVIWSVFFLSSKTDKTFYELVADTLGEWTARILFGCYALYFLFASIIPVIEQNLLLRSAFYETTPSVLISAPFYLLSAYFCTKSLRCLGRCADLLVPVSLLSLLVILGLSQGTGEFDALLPTLQTAPRTLLFSGGRALPWFADCAYPIFFLGHFKYEKGLTWKVMLSYAAGALLVLLFLCDFYAMFSTIAPKQSSAISMIGQYFTGVNVIGRIDLIFVYLLSGGILLYLMLPLQLSVRCLQSAFGMTRRGDILFSVLVNAVLFLVNAVLNYAAIDLGARIGNLIFPVFLLFAYLLPVLAWTMQRRRYA